MMNLDKRKMVILWRAIDLTLLLTLASIIASFFQGQPGPSKLVLALQERSDSSSLTRVTEIVSFFSTYAFFPKLVIRLLFIGILFQLRKIIKSLLNKDSFVANDAVWIRKMSSWFAIATCVFFVGSVLVVILIGFQGDKKLISESFSLLLNIAWSYLLPALIVFTLSEVFIYGEKLKQESELTI